MKNRIDSLYFAGCAFGYDFALPPVPRFRSVREYTHENAQASREYQLVENGIKTCMYPGYPELYMQLNKK